MLVSILHLESFAASTASGRADNGRRTFLCMFFSAWHLRLSAARDERLALRMTYETGAECRAARHRSGNDILVCAVDGCEWKANDSCASPVKSQLIFIKRRSEEMWSKGKINEEKVSRIGNLLLRFPLFAQLGMRWNSNLWAVSGAWRAHEWPQNTHRMQQRTINKNRSLSFVETKWKITPISPFAPKRTNKFQWSMH